MEKLTAELLLLQLDINEITDKRKELNTLLLHKNKEWKAKKKEIENLETDRLIDQMVVSVKNIVGFETILKSELEIIAKGMDNTDYTEFGLPRMMDLDSILKIVIKIKNMYPQWQLIDLLKMGQYDCLPPKNSYDYVFATHDELKNVHYYYESVPEY